MLATHSVVIDLPRDPLCRELRRIIITFVKSASAVSTGLTVVDNSYVMKISGGGNLWLSVESYRHRGSHVLGRTH